MTTENPFDPTWVQELLNADSIVDASVVSVNEILFFKYEKEAENRRKEPGPGFGSGTGSGSGQGQGQGPRSPNNGDDKISKIVKNSEPLLL